mgnify:CR=1 FL=1
MVYERVESRKFMGEGAEREAMDEDVRVGALCVNFLLFRTVLRFAIHPRLPY